MYPSTSYVPSALGAVQLNETEVDVLDLKVQVAPAAGCPFFSTTQFK